MLILKKKKINLYQKFVGFLTKKGKKTKAKKILDSTFLKISKRVKKPLHKVMLRLFRNLNVFLEYKVIKKRKNKHIVPFSINLHRRAYLVLKWLIKAVHENKKKIPFSKKLINEILLIIGNKTSKATKLKATNNSQVLLNRSNIHFRW